MNLKTSTDVLTELQQSQTDAIKVYVDQANEICTKYWSDWKVRNEREIRSSHVETQKWKVLGSYAPKIAIIGNGNKHTVEWNNYRPTAKNRPTLHMSTRVKPLKNGDYGVSCFPKHAEWEWEMISEAEEKLKPLRETMELLHKQSIEVGRLIRKTQKA